MNARIFQHDFSTSFHPGLDLKVERLTWQAQGGPAEAVLICSMPAGQEGRLAQLAVDGLRCPVEVTNQTGEKVWWGFVNRIEVQQEGFQLVYDLDDLVNRVCVQYWQPEPQLEWTGIRTFTDWADDSASQAVFGVRERIFNLGPMSAVDAAAARDVLLAQHARPKARLACQRSVGAKAEVRFLCRGWWETLKWRIARFNDGYEGLVKPLTLSQNFGRLATSDAKAAQSFKTGYGGWLCGEAVVNIRMVGSCTDQVVCELCADAGGVPGTVLASATVDAAKVVGVRWWVKFVFNSRPIISANTPYWLVFSRSGGLSTNNYYQLYADSTNMYTGGKAMIWNGSTWVDLSGGSTDFNFYVAGFTSRSTRLQELAGANRGGQFLTGLQIKADVAGDTLLRREGIWDCQAEMVELLALGDANGTRLYGQVDAERRLTIFSEPASADWRFSMTGDGQLRVKSGRPAWCPDQPAGERVWLANPGLEALPVIERVEWTPQGGLQVTW
jgi:hypothetical protein